MLLLPRTLGIVILVSLPGLGLITWASLRARNVANATLIEETSTIALMLAREQKRIVETSEPLLRSMSQIDEVREAKPTCSSLLSSILQRDPNIIGLLVANAAGRTVCSSKPAMAGRGMGEPDWFRNTIERRSFTVGRYHPGQLTGQPVLLVGLPVIVQDTVRSVMVAALNVQRLLSIIDKIPLPPGATIAIVDGDANVVAAQPHYGRVIGKRFSDPNAVVPGEANETLGPDGVTRMYAFASLPAGVGSDIKVAVGIPTAGLHKFVSRTRWQAALAAAITMLLALIVARFRMAGKMNRQARGLISKEHFFQSLIEKSFDAVLILTEDSTVMYASPAFERITGYQPDEIVGLSVYDFTLSNDDGTREDLTFEDNPGSFVRTRFLHRSGEARELELTGRNMVRDPAIEGIVVNLRDVSERVAAEQALITSRDQLRHLSRRSVAALEGERRRISREVHDDLGQYVTALGLDVASLRNHATDTDTNARRTRLDAMAELVTAAARSIRNISRQLRFEAVDSAGLSDAVVNYGREFAERSGVEVVADIQPSGNNVPEPVVTAVLGVLQEALTNVAKHSGATRVKTRLYTDGGDLHLEVADNGSGFPPAHGGRGLGIVSMRERALACNGTLVAQTSEDGGVIVRASFPL